MAKNGVSLAVWNGSDLGGMERPPEGVQELLEEWFGVAGVTTPLNYRIKTREVGAAHTKRVTPRGLRDANFIHARVKPETGGNENCWLVWITVEHGLNAQMVYAALERVCTKINDRSVERKTPAPEAPADPFAALGLAELKARVEALTAQRNTAKANRDAAESARDGRRIAVEQARPVAVEAQRKLAEAERLLQDSEREVTLHTQAQATHAKDIALVEAALERRQATLATEAAEPLRELVRQEAQRLGISEDAIYASLRSQT